MKRKWPVLLWFENCPGSESWHTKEEIIYLMKSGLFPELKYDFPELARFDKSYVSSGRKSAVGKTTNSIV